MATPEELTERALPEKLPSYGVLVLESHHAPNFSMEWRTHRFVKVVYVLSGQGTFLIEGERVGFASRDVIIVPPGKRNRIVDDPAAASSLYVFCLDAELLKFDPTIVGSLVAGRLRRSRAFSARVERVLRRLLFEQSDRCQTTALAMVAEGLRLIQAVLHQPLDVESEAPPDSGARREMRSYLDYLEYHFYEAGSIDEAAAELGIPRRTFTALFRELTGTTWLKYVRGLRMKHAAALLKTTDLPIASIAFECGYEDLSTFYRRFKEEYKLAPGQYRDGAP